MSIVMGRSTLAVAGQSSSTFTVQAMLVTSVPLACATGSAATAEDSALITRRTEDGRYCLDGRRYRFIHFSGHNGHTNDGQWGIFPITSANFHVYYDPTLAPPIRTQKTIDDDGTLEVLVVW